MELLQLIVNVLTLIVMLVGLPYCLYAWFRGAVAMFRFHHRGLAFHLDGLILPDDGVADFEVEGFFLPGVHA